jgi:hypothetical protein
MARVAMDALFALYVQLSGRWKKDLKDGIGKFMQFSRVSGLARLLRSRIHVHSITQLSAARYLR